MHKGRSNTVNISFKCCHWYSLMKGLRLGRERRTSPLVWLAAIICAVLAFAVIIAGIVVFVVYMVYQPQMPYIKVTYAKLLALQYDQSGLLETQMILNLEAENDNAKAHASFSGIDFTLQFHQLAIANLRADPFDVPNNSSHTLNYVVDSSPIPLDRSGMAEVDSALKNNRIFFELVGQARTQWRVGALVSVKFWAHINCQLQFIPSNGTNIGLHCSSKSR